MGDRVGLVSLIGEQVLFGCVLVVATTVTHGAGTVVAMFGLTRVHRLNRTHLGRGFIISVLVLAMLLISLGEAVLWAYVYVALDAVPEFEAALYFSMVTFTTLGYGDITLDPAWRVLASFEAANGIVIFGWTTALIVAYVQRMTPHRDHHG